MSHKREREAAVAPTGSDTVLAADDASLRHSPPPPSSQDSDEAAANFGSFVWNDVSIILFYRLMHELQGACLAIAKAPAEERAEMINTLQEDAQVVWAVAQHHLPADRTPQTEQRYTAYVEAFVQLLRSCVADVDVSDTVGLCKAFLRLLEEQGFPEAEFGPLANHLAETFLREDTQGYSYSDRPSLAMPVPLRYDGDKRSEEEHSRKRVGFEVVLPAEHPHAEVNTRVQLSEPKKRKPVLDEYRIFSLPKKAAAFAADDFLVDDELLHRAYVVLATHLDAFGSLKGLSPYARLLLWNLLDRNEVLFSTLYDQHVSSESTRQQLLKLRELVAVHKLAFDETRVAARRVAGIISWYATSAQWRDQALSKLDELEESNWYLLGDVYRSGGKAVFPNYAQSPFVVHLALGVLRKLDKLHSKELEGAPPVHAVVEQLLLPLLQGEAPELSDFCFAHGAFTGDSVHWQRRRRKLKAVLDETATKERMRKHHATASAPGAPAACGSLSSTRRSDVHVCLCASLVFPMQCLGELLELCSLVLFSTTGFEAFTRSFLASNWEEEDTILAYLLRREPTNPSLVPLVGIPRLYKDFVTGIQLLIVDKMLPYVVESRRLAEAHPHVSLHTRSYPYWKSLASLFIEEDRFDDLCVVRVSTLEDTTCLYTMAGFERAPKVWPEDLRELQEEEDQLRRQRSIATATPEDRTSGS